jgi:hypothetical protein
MGDLDVQEMGRVQCLASSKQARLDLLCCPPSQQDFQERRSVDNDHRLSRSARRMSAGMQPGAHLIQRRPLSHFPDLVQEVVRQRQTRQRRAGFQPPVHIVGDVANLNHHGHAIHIGTCYQHVNPGRAAVGASP